MMYRQILIESSQRVFQRILWREDPSEHIEAYELNTITYGMALSPFLAIRYLFALAKEYQEAYPEAANIICKFMYVDNLLFGTSSKVEAVRLITEGINWNFISAYSPHFSGEGGSWEVEAILNSRSLFPLSTHPLDLQPTYEVQPPADYVQNGQSLLKSTSHLAS